MGNIYVSTSKLKNIYLGTSKTKKIYKDTTMIWQSAIPVAKPTQLTVTKTYNGSSQGNGYTKPDGVILSGNASGTNAGTYTATYTPDADHIWADTEDRTPVTVTMTIGRASVGSKPTTTVSKTYTGSEQTNGYTTPTGVTMTGSNKGTNASTYTATYTPDSNHKWSDNSTSAVTVTMTIARASVGAKPTTAVSKDYNGSSQTNGYTKPTGVSMTGNASGTNGGTYSATYTPDNNHKWSDGTTGAVTVTLTINYAWTKWNVNITATGTTTTYLTGQGSGYSRYENLDKTYQYALGFYRYCTLDTTTGKYVLSTPAGSSAKWYTLNDKTYQKIANGNLYGYFCGLHTSAEGNTENAFDIVYQCENSAISVASMRTKIRFDNTNEDTDFNVYRKVVTRSYSKGTTNLGTVRSTSKTAYPENGTTDNTNWYVKNW